MIKTILILIIIALIIPISVYAPCPTECNTAESITDESYTNTNSYSNDDFYKNSDPAKWNTFDKKFCWSCVPDEKFPLISPEKLNLKNIWSTGTQGKLTAVQIKGRIGEIPNLGGNIFYHVNVENARKAVKELYGVTVQQFGENSFIKDGKFTTGFGEKQSISIEDEFYKDKFIRVNEKGAIIFHFSGGGNIDEIPKGDSMIIIMSSNHVVKFKEHKIKYGSIRKNADGSINFVPSSISVLINNIWVRVKEHTNLCENLDECSGDYIYFGNKKMIIDGKNIKVNFANDNGYFDLVDGYKNIFPGSKQVISVKEEDSLGFIIGSDELKGKIQVIKNENLLPEVYPEGSVKMYNGGHWMDLESTKIKSLGEVVHYEDRLTSMKYTDTVPLTVILERSDEVHIFDESSIIHTPSKLDYYSQNELRQKIVNDFGVSFRGYIDSDELEIMDREFNKWEEKFNIKIKNIKKKYDDDKTMGLTIWEGTVSDNTEEAAAVNLQTPIIITINERNTWSKHAENDRVKVGNLEFNSVQELFENDLGHELSHVIVGINSPFTIKESVHNPTLQLVEQNPFVNNFKSKMENMGFIFKPKYKNLEFYDEDKDIDVTENVLFDYDIVSSPEGAVPNTYAEKNLGEFIAEIGKLTLQDSKWFSEHESDEVNDKRNVLKQTFVDELKRYAD